MPPAMDAGEALATQRMAIGLATDAERLNALDDLWTSYLGMEPDRATIERDLPELRTLVDEIGELFGRVGRGAGELREVISALENNLDDEVRDALRQHPLGDRVMELLPEVPFAELVVDACSIVEREAPEEITQVAAKLRRLADDGYSPGDIGPRMKCAVIWVGAGASLIGYGGAALIPPILVPGVIVGSLGVLATTIATANGWSCKKPGDLAVATP
jgi:hypothetical protein